MKLSSKLAIFLGLVVLVFVGSTALATQAQEAQNPTTPEGARTKVDRTTLLSMERLVKENHRSIWKPARALLGVYREIGSCPTAAKEINEMLIQKNENGALALIRLVKQELIRPHESPITSTRQVKRVFIRAIQKAEEGEWRTKRELITTFLILFPENDLTPTERETVVLLKNAIEEELNKTTMYLEKVLLLLIKEVGKTSPLDKSVVKKEEVEVERTSSTETERDSSPKETPFLLEKR